VSTSIKAFTLAAVCGVLAGQTLRASLPPDAGRVHPEELRAAREAQVYLVIDTEAPSLEIRSRGLTLGKIPLLAIELRIWQSGDLRELPGGGDLPTTWTVTELPVPPAKRLINPGRRVQPETADINDDQAPDLAAPQPVVTYQPPSAYTVEVDSGWRLQVCQEISGKGLVDRFIERLSTGWAVVRGRRVAKPHILLLRLEAEDAKQLYHLFEKRGRILLIGAPSVSTSPSEIAARGPRL
jgi:hypothetical protein